MAGKPLAIITGASTGIGREMARVAAEDGCDMVLAADEAAIETVADDLRATGADVVAVQADLGTEDGVEQLWQAIGDRRIEYMIANAGRGLGHAFLEQEKAQIEEVIHLNVTGTTALLHRAARTLRAQGSGRILVTGSIAGEMPGSYQAVYNATKAYLDILAISIRHELKETGVTVTCLMPGPTDTEFFDRAGMEDTRVGQSDHKTDPARVARKGYEAMKKGQAVMDPSFATKVQSAFAKILPESLLARMHRELAEPEETPNG